MLNQALLRAAASGRARDPLWTLADLDGPVGMWFNDASNVTNESGAASQIDDIGGLGLNLTQPTAANRPAINPAGLNGRRTLSFDGSNDVLTTTSATARAMFQNARGGWAFAVYKKVAADGGAAGDRTLFSFPRGATSATPRFSAHISAAGAADRPTLAVRRLDGDSIAALAATTGNGTAWQMFGEVMRWENRNGFVYVNGASDASNATLTAAAGVTSNTASLTQIALGGGADGSGFADVELAEIVFGSGSYPSQSDIDRIFGYLAHRWGLTANLPSDHPYKVNPPRTKKDPNFASVVSLLQFRGPQDSLMFPDKTRKVWTPFGNAKIDASDPDFPDGCLLLDGSGDYLTTSAGADWNFGSGDFKFRGFIKAANVTSNLEYVFTTRGGAASIGIAIHYSTDGLKLIGWNTGGGVLVQINSGSILSNTKHYIEGGRVGNNWYLSIDGVIVGTATASGAVGNASSVDIGRDPSGSGPRYMNGRIGAFEFYKGVGPHTVNFTPPTSFPNS